MAAVTLSNDDDHPLVLELNSLRAAVSKYQHEAHAASVKLQRHSLDNSNALERSRFLEHRNALLEEEIATLRANPDSTASTSATSQAAELTLALRKLSDKLTLTEEALLSRTHEAANLKSELSRLHTEVSSAHTLAAEARAREEQGREREAELGRKLRAAQEERKMADLVVQEYADLVRSLEGRKKSVSSSIPSTPSSGNNDSSSTLVDSLTEGRYGLQKLLEEHNAETERLAQENFRLQGEIAILSSNLEVERQGAEHDRAQLAAALHDLEKYRIDDTTAAKMVSRYMKFSQSSTDALQKTMEGQKLRHAATLSTMTAEVTDLQKTLSFERRQCEKLRDALDELSEDISREAYGRRREIALRLALLGREERLAESLSRWIRKSKESFSPFKFPPDHVGDLNNVPATFNEIISSADSILHILNGESSPDELKSGSVARILVAQDAVLNLTRELQLETDRRLAAERKIAHSYSGSISSLDGHKEPFKDAPQTKAIPLESNAHSQGLISPERVELSIEGVVSAHVKDEAQETPRGDKELSTSQLPTDPSYSLATPEDPSLVSTENGALPSVPDVDVSHEVTHSVISVLDSNDAPISPLSPVGVLSNTESHPIVEIDTLQDPPSRNIHTVAVPSPGLDLSLSPGPGETEAKEEPTQSVTIRNVIDFPTAIPGEIDAPTQQQSISLSTPPLITQTLPSQSFTQDTFPLLAELRRVTRRYDATQRAFRDCHLALKDLKQAITELPASDTVVVVQRAVERLDDFNEDARVELEIRIADEERIMAGYEALLSIPGAISEEINESDLRHQMRAFVDGTDQTVAKNAQQFSNKLDDLQHDIACIKMVVHELSTSYDSAPSPGASSAKASSGWPSWTAGLLTPSRPVSPGPTFGSVMTSPRLRHSSSFTRSRKQSVDSSSPGSDLLASLGLRISMPSHVIPAALPSRLPSSRVDPRPRTTSGLHMLGLGKRNPSFGYHITPAKSPPVSRQPSMSDGKIQSEDEGGDEDSDSDVE